jgi:hypothetical protein
MSQSEWDAREKISHYRINHDRSGEEQAGEAEEEDDFYFVV